eukprot:855301-Pelagomonas_calceolata.AAC.1
MTHTSNERKMFASSTKARISMLLLSQVGKHTRWACKHEHVGQQCSQALPLHWHARLLRASKTHRPCSKDASRYEALLARLLSQHKTVTLEGRPQDRARSSTCIGCAFWEEWTSECTCG